MSSGQTGDFRHMAPAFAHLAQALTGVDLPQDKRGLLLFLERKDAEPEIVELIDEVPDQEFQTVADIMTAAEKSGEIDRGDNRSRMLH